LISKRAVKQLLAGLLLASTPAGYAQAITSRPERDRAVIHNQIVLKKLNIVLGSAMMKNDIQMWIVFTREDNVDPVLPLVSPDGAYAGCRNAYVFVYRDNARPLRIVLGCHGGMQGEGFFDENIPALGDEVRLRLHDLAVRYQPKHIGVDTSNDISTADGLTATMKDYLTNAFGPDYSSHMVSAQPLIVDYLNTRIPEEEPYFREAALLTRRIWMEAFTSEVVHPGVTTVGDVLWFVRQRCTDFGVGYWFRPDLNVQRPGRPFEAGEVPPDETVLEKGDVISLDFGINYLDFATDYRGNAYILKDGETDVPEGLKKAMRNSNDFQQIFLAEFKPGRTGNEVWDSTMKKAQAAGLEPEIYSHSIGNFGHFVGAAIGVPWKGKPGLHESMALQMGSYTSMEFNVRTHIPEWNGQYLAFQSEDNVMMTPEGEKFFIPTQKTWVLIRTP
jgi:Xaa-Pro dipeptidase